MCSLYDHQRIPPTHSANLDSIWNLDVYSKIIRNNLILDYNSTKSNIYSYYVNK